MVPLVLGIFSAQFAGIVITIHMNVSAFFAAFVTNSLVALVKIGPAAIRAPFGVTNVRGVKRVDDHGAITTTIPDAAAPVIRIAAEIAYVDERITIGSDPARVVHPTADADAPSTSCFRR